MTKFYKFYLYFQYLCAALWVFVGGPPFAVLPYFITGLGVSSIKINVYLFLFNFYLIFWLIFLFHCAVFYFSIKAAQKLSQSIKLNAKDITLTVLSLIIIGFWAYALIRLIF